MIYRKGAMALIAVLLSATAAQACPRETTWRDISGPRQSDDYDDYGVREARYGGRDSGRSIFSEREAVQIARSYGIRQVNYIRFEDDSWEIEGCDGRGLEIEIEILDGSGELLRIEKSDDWTCQ